MFVVSPSPFSKKIVSHEGQLYGNPSSILDEPFTLAGLTIEEMAEFPWDKVCKEFSVTNEGRGGHPAYIVRYVPYDVHLGERFQNVFCIHMNRLEHGSVVLEFAKGRIGRTKSLVSRLTINLSCKIIALALDVPKNQAKAFPWC